MASRMKQWLVLVAAGTGLVAAWLLPLESRVLRDRQVDPAVELRYEELSEEYRWTYEALRRVRWSDSLAALTLNTAKDGIGVYTPLDGDIDDVRMARMTEKVAGELEAFGGRRPDMHFGFVYQPVSHGTDEYGRGGSNQDRTETYVGVREGQGYCLQLRMHHPEKLNEIFARDLVDTDGIPPTSGTLGPCRFYLKYGLAGAGIQHWLEEGGVGFAMESGGEKSSQGNYSRRSYLRFRSVARSRTAVRINECIAGEADACAAVVLAPRVERSLLGGNQEIVRRSPAMSLGQSSVFGFIFRDEGFLLSDLEAEFGAEAFERFWTSEADMPKAFEAAFGVDLGTWVLSWVDSVMGIEPGGPGLPRSASSGTMLMVALLLGIAFLRARRAEVV